MRVNVYREELTEEVEVVFATPDTGNRYTGVRFLLDSSPNLHHGDGDDDRSAVTIWFSSPDEGIAFLDVARGALEAERDG